MIKTVSVRDLVARQFFRGELNRYDIFVRYLAIEEYYGKNDFGFRLYSKMQNNRTGTDYYASYAIGRFRALIESYEVNGYDEKSAIPVGSNLAIWDGSHRVALGLYHNLPNISVDIHPEAKFYEYKIDWFLKNGFSLEEVKIIMDKAEEVLSKNPIKFTGFLWGAAVPYAEEIFKDIEFFGEVSDVKKFSFKSRNFYNHMLKQIYVADDIDPSKIDIKAQYLAAYAPEFIYFHFQPSKLYDHWRIKGQTGLPLSLAVERVKSVVREKYKHKIENYFYDIIMHICDNQYQSDFCDCVCFPSIDVKKLLQEIHSYKYVLLGMREKLSPHMPENFPEAIPVGKDIDILVTPEDCNFVVEAIKKFAMQYKNKYEVVVNVMGAQTHIILTKHKKWIFLIDVYSKHDNLNENFTEDAIKNREEKDGYYVLSPFYEYCYRFQKFRHRPGNFWHLEYLYKHAKDFDEKTAEKYGDFSDIS